jgi:uncharacterized surface protein with fasciclin (FAS1) repeats
MLQLKINGMKTKLMFVAALAAACSATGAFAQMAMAGNTVLVGGEAMYPKKDIVSNAMNSKDHTTLVAAVKAADLVTTLQSKGPFTVFAPVNDAFENLPAGTVESLLKPENKAKLAGILTYHVVPGKYDYNSLAKMIHNSNGKASVKTVAGGLLYLMMNGDHNILVGDENGKWAAINTYDVMQSNGVIHSIDAVLLPKM